jgi:hypothetical protein
MRLIQPSDLWVLLFTGNDGIYFKVRDYTGDPEFVEPKWIRARNRL